MKKSTIFKVHITCIFLHVLYTQKLEHTIFISKYTKIGTKYYCVKTFHIFIHARAHFFCPFVLPFSYSLRVNFHAAKFPFRYNRCWLVEHLDFDPNLSRLWQRLEQHRKPVRFRSIMKWIIQSYNNNKVSMRTVC